ncbi:MAG: hypothetical protein ACRDL1_06420 [Solirubrobacterales bacterium]
MRGSLERWALMTLAVLLLGLSSCGDDSSPEFSASDDAADARRREANVASECEANPPLRQKQVLLACGDFTHGRVLQIRTGRSPSGQKGCLEIYGLGDGDARACGFVPSERVPSKAGEALVADSIAQTGARDPLELYGATSPDVDSVVIHYAGIPETEQRTPATLIRVTDPAALRSARLEGPFGYFVAEVPPDTTQATAGEGVTIGRADLLPEPLGDLARTVFIYGNE